MECDIFIGRFHPLLVHLPIGIFILGYFLEILFRLGYNGIVSSRKVIVATYALGFLFGLLAALTGWLLSFSNNYGIASLNNHKVVGIVTLVVLLLVIIYQLIGKETKAKRKLLASTVAILLIGITGHLGGNLTHGANYLTEYGPDILKPTHAFTTVNLNTEPTDSIKIYPAILKPAIQDKCYACHNSKDYYGGLVLDSFSNLFKDANHKVPIVVGDADKSELFKRVSLPLGRKEFMPPKGKGLSYTEIQVLRYWIDNGADSLTSFNAKNMSEELIALVNRDYGLDFRIKPYYETVKSDSLSRSLFNEINSSGFRVNYLGKNNFLLDVQFKGDSITAEQISTLNKVADQVTFLKLSGSKLSADVLKEMNVFAHLTRIDLSNNSLDNKVVDFLVKHSNIEAINLNYNAITKDALERLLASDTLKRVYVWNTEIEKDDIDDLSQKYSKVELISEFKFNEVAKPKSVFEQRGVE